MPCRLRPLSVLTLPLAASALLISLGCGKGLGMDFMTDLELADTAESAVDTGEPGTEPIDTATEPTDTSTEPLWDGDGDGYPADVDCDDLNPALNYDDVDGDGVSTCDGDCDDMDPWRSPSMVELCDDVDNDCDAQVEQDGDGVCGIWWLEGSSWKKDALNPSGSLHAPSSPIEVSLSLEEWDEVWVLTGSSYHILDPDTRTWTDSGNRDAIFPTLAGVSLQAGYAVAAQYHSDGMIYLYLNGEDMAWIVQLNRPSMTSSLVGSYDMSTLTDWQSSLAPAPTQLVGSWIDIYNHNDWGVGSPAASCASSASTLGTYMAFLDSSGRVYFYDGNWCYQFVSATSAAGVAFFNYPGSPPPDIAQAITWTGDRVFFFGP